MTSAPDAHARHVIYPAALLKTRRRKARYPLPPIRRFNLLALLAGGALFGGAGVRQKLCLYPGADQHQGAMAVPSVLACLAESPAADLLSEFRRVIVKDAEATDNWRSAQFAACQTAAHVLSLLPVKACR